MPRLKLLFVVSECVPYAKTGGLADVAGALPLALAERGHDVRVVLPRYKIAKRWPATRLPEPLAVPVGRGEAWASVWEAPMGTAGAKAYLLEHDAMFDRDGIYNDAHGDFGDNLARFTFLSRGALRLCDQLGFEPDVVHAHDWPTALVPIYMNTLEARSRAGRAASVLTVHNLAYQGWFSKESLPLTRLGWDEFNPRSLEAYDRINLLKGGLYHATMVTTVSPRYAREIQTPAGGEHLDGVLRDRGSSVLGILNGIDDGVWNPAIDKHIAAPYTVDDLTGKAACKAALQVELGLPVRPDVPLIGVVSRLIAQKGIDFIAGALAEILALDAQMVVLGSGEAWAERLFTQFSAASPRFRARIGMNEPLAHRIEAGSDIFLMPSRYEPCGLNQLYSQRYGTIPVVCAVGGLDDTVTNEVTGFKYDELSSDALAQTVAWAVFTYRNRREHFRDMQARGMRKPMGWQHASRQYEALYRLAMAQRR